MSRLMLTNVDPDATDDDIHAFLRKYGLPDSNILEHLEGDGSRPSVVLTYDDVDAETLHKFAERIHHMFWRGRELVADVMHDRFA
ncbi:RNA recognition motif domain-containing protein [Cupriavidus plantarum]|uniref:RNA-binding protein n=1 Tax=Cupriavidus plantarum TaxID=942865 RepID=A0A316EKY8_9BURK|nr:RNA-binding protein [Cupriavidus plantarum]NYI02891.1 hypothetical protein [Cupriavidus plantarum]PWK32389.1 hypothetical protein C7419_107180 [Cupriavidus plantarum]REE87179.1 hypothetical protein C7418_5237 [Cupriavidus plantarum]RLK29565.1 hypothetical protein C7417_5274 [Cupriavidus plantarum]CAG2152767.1 hypothetical protein LMG26296_05195 [Cupriavidus plantarum]